MRTSCTRSFIFNVNVSLCFLSCISFIIPPKKKNEKWSCFQVKGTVFCTDRNGALVDITAKSSAYLPLQEASIFRIKHVEEAGIVPGLKEEFVIIGENEADDSLVLSLKSIQYDLAWERCRQLQAEDVVIKGKVSIHGVISSHFVLLFLCFSP